MQTQLIDQRLIEPFENSLKSCNFLIQGTNCRVRGWVKSFKVLNQRGQSGYLTLLLGKLSLETVK